MQAANFLCPGFSGQRRQKPDNDMAPPPFAISKQPGPLLPLKLAFVTQVGLGEARQTPSFCGSKFLQPLYVNQKLNLS